eukprot:scaffold184_cov316-Pinguiococcus_pyrenoidosus.AAC.44
MTLQYYYSPARQLVCTFRLVSVAHADPVAMTFFALSKLRSRMMPTVAGAKAWAAKMMMGDTYRTSKIVATIHEKNHAVATSLRVRAKSRTYRMQKPPQRACMA